jgi:6-phosphofructo-2-kinase
LQNGFGNLTGSPGKGTRLLLDGTQASLHPAELVPPHTQDRQPPAGATIEGGMDQSAAFFDPNNKAAAELREKVALETLDDLLNYVLYEGGSVGILDATNSSLARRKAVLDRIRQVAGQQIGVVFLESECNDEQLLEANMRLKLQGPDYRDQDPVKALEDFKKRGRLYVVRHVKTN